jgi:hypothetical protein
MHQLREAIMADLVWSAGWLVTLHGSALPDRHFLEPEIRTSHKGSRISLWQGKPYNKRWSSTSTRCGIGYFLASSHPTTVLFNSGAYNSFITSSFVAKHSLSIAKLKHTMLVSSPGGEMRTKHICPAVSISIRGVDIPSNLILLDYKGIDIILGMDWLSKNDRVI